MGEEASKIAAQESSEETVSIPVLVSQDDLQDKTEASLSARTDRGASGPLAENLSAGTLIAGKYEIMKLLGKGGMSAVYKARHLEIDKIMALKVLNNQLANDEQSLRRFKQEAQAASKLTHPGVVAVFDCGTSEAGLPYLVMEYVEGKTLSELLKESGPLGLERFLSLMIQVTDALAHAHGHGVVHRDLKPSNIMLSSNSGKEQARIVDFGIAKIVSEASEPVQQLTQTGEVFGSPLYMSPEQCSGGQIKSTADIYSLGCVMYELLSGKPPHQGVTVFETIHKHMKEEPPALQAPQLTDDSKQKLELILLRCLAKDPDDRFQSMSELKAQLRKVGLNLQSGLIEKLGAAWHLAGAKRKAANRSKLPALIVALSLSMFSVGMMLFGILEERKQVEELQSTTETFNIIAEAQSDFLLIAEASRVYFAAIIFQQGVEREKEAERRFEHTTRGISKRLKELDQRMKLDTPLSKRYRLEYRKELMRVPQAAEVSADALLRAQSSGASGIFNAENIAVASKLSRVAERGTLVLQDMYRQQRILHRTQMRKFQQSTSLVNFMFYCGAAINGLVIISLFIYFRKEHMERMRKLSEHASRFSKKRGLEPRVAGGDELDELDNVLSELAAALSEAEEREKELLQRLGQDADKPLSSE